MNQWKYRFLPSHLKARWSYEDYLRYRMQEMTNKQIEQLKSWSNSGDILLGVYSNELFEIRIKELKFLRLTMNKNRRIEFQEGYKALEKYIEYIAK